MKAKWGTRAALGLVTMAVAAALAVWLWPSREADAPVITGETKRGPSLDEQTSLALAAAADAGTRTVSGRVLNEAGEPVPGVPVALYVAETMPFSLQFPACDDYLMGCSDPDAVRAVVSRVAAGTLMPKSWATTTTDAEGRYVFDTAPGVATRVIARTAGLVGTASGEDEEISLAAPSERVAVLQGPDGRPLPGLRVWAVSADLLEAYELTSDGAGEVRVSTADASPVLYGAPQGYVPNLGVFDLSPVVFASPRQLTVRTLMGGEPIDAMLLVTLYGRPHELNTVHGVLVLRDLRADVYEVQAKTATLRARAETVDLNSEEQRELVLELRASGRVLVTVVDAQGLPVKGVTAGLESSDLSVSQSAEEEGSLVVLGPVPEGEFTLSVNADGMRESRRMLDVTPGDHPVEVTLSPAEKLTGTVVDAAGKPVPDAELQFTAPGTPAQFSRADDQGVFSFEGAPVGEGLVSAGKDDIGRGEARAALPGTVTVKLEARAVFLLDVHGSRGEVLEDTRCSLVNRELGRSEYLQLDDQGHARIAGLSAGGWMLQISAANHLAVMRPVTLVDGREVHEELVLDEGVGVEGQVVDHDGKPVPKAMVFAPETHGVPETDEQGRFTLKGLAPGRVRLVAGLDELTVEQEVEVPAKGVLLRLPAKVIATGRVVDEQGAAVRRFEANGQTFEGPTGTFSTPVREGQLSVWAEGYDTMMLETQGGDVGTVTLKALERVEGEVVDAQGKPLAGVSVRVLTGSAETLTTANGRFKLVLDEGVGASDEAPTLVAMRAGLSAVKKLERGRFMRLELQRGTHVTGRVHSGQVPGGGVDVTIEPADQVFIATRSAVTDAQGTFEVDLFPGRWRFTARGYRLSRVIEVHGEAAQVDLSAEQGQCGLEVKSVAEIIQVLLTPGTRPPETGNEPGSLQLSGGPPGQPYVVNGLPCGDYMVSVLTSVGERGGPVHLEAHTFFDATIAREEPEPPGKPPEEPHDITPVPDEAPATP